MMGGYVYAVLHTFGILKVVFQVMLYKITLIFMETILIKFEGDAAAGEFLMYDR